MREHADAIIGRLRPDLAVHLETEMTAGEPAAVIIRHATHKRYAYCCRPGAETPGERRSDCRGPGLTGAHAHHGLERGHPYFAVADGSRSRVFGDRLHDLIDRLIIDEHL